MSSNRVWVLLVGLLGVFAFGVVASSSASAFTSCYRVAEKGTGNRDSSCATNEGGGKNEYINIEKLEKEIKAGEWCAKVKEATTGNYEDNVCTKKVAKKEYIKVKVPTFWLCRKGGTEKYTESLCKEKAVGGELVPAGTKPVSATATDLAARRPECRAGYSAERVSPGIRVRIPGSTEESRGLSTHAGKGSSASLDWGEDGRKLGRYEHSHPRSPTSSKLATHLPGSHGAVACPQRVTAPMRRAAADATAIAGTRGQGLAVGR